MLKQVSALIIALTLVPLAWAQLGERQAKLAAQELHLLVTEGTGVVADLQPDINAGKLPKDQAQLGALTSKLQARYNKSAGSALNTKEPGLMGDIRRAYVQAYTDTLAQKQGILIKGGQDALVPAHFRALVLNEFNKAMAGRVRAYASNRESELINSDWSIKNVMKQSPLMGEAQTLVDAGNMEPVLKRVGSSYLGYWPMKLQPACVACHAQNGLKQQVGQFGGALIAEVSLQ